MGRVPSAIPRSAFIDALLRGKRPSVMCANDYTAANSFAVLLRAASHSGRIA
jgi:hypothetical protein